MLQMITLDIFAYNAVYNRHQAYLERVRNLLLPNRLRVDPGIIANQSSGCNSGADSMPPSTNDPGVNTTSTPPTTTQPETLAHATLDMRQLDDMQVRPLFVDCCHFFNFHFCYLPVLTGYPWTLYCPVHPCYFPVRMGSLPVRSGYLPVRIGYIVI